MIARPCLPLGHVDEWWHHVLRKVSDCGSEGEGANDSVAGTIKCQWTVGQPSGAAHEALEWRGQCVSEAQEQKLA